MSISALLRSRYTAWLLGAAMLGAASAVAFALMGWFGIGLVGLFGLMISVNVAMHGGQAVSHVGFGGGDVTLHAKQLEETRKSSSSPEQKMAAAAEKATRSRLHYLINTIFIAMTALGFGMFVQHQL